jgi:YVTN family beta-propeller protein
LAISVEGVVLVALLDTNALARGVLPSTALEPGSPVGLLASHVTFNPAGTVAYVANQGSENVSVIDVASNAQTATIAVGSGAWNVLVSGDGRRLYATTDEGDVVVVNTADNSVLSRSTMMRGDAVRGLALSPDQSRLYLAGRQSGNVYEMDAASGAQLRVFPIGGIPQRVVVSPDASKLFVANEEWGVDIVDLATGAITSQRIGRAYGLALSPDHAEMYATIPDLGLVHVLDPATAAIRKTISVGGRPRVVAFSATGAFALVANEWGWVTYIR